MIGIRKSEFLKNVLTLVTGTGLSQMVTIGSTVLLTRLYSMEQFGTYALFISVTSVLGNIATFKYSKAILLPQKSADASILFLISILIAGFFSLLLLMWMYFYGYAVSARLNDENLNNWILFIPLYIALNAIIESCSTWLNRLKKYSSLAQGRVIKALISAITNISIVYLNYEHQSLVIGELIGILILSCYLMYSSISCGVFAGLVFEKRKVKNILYFYRDFPKYNIFSDFINVLSSQLPMILLTTFFGVSSVGAYSLTKKILDAPINLLSGAIMEVFRQKAVEQYYEVGNCLKIFVKTFKSLVIVSLFPTLLLVVFSPFVFQSIFGEEWRLSGELARILAIMYFFKFAISPLTYVYFIFNKQKESLFLNIVLLCLVTSSLYLGHLYTDNLILTILMFCIAYSLVYVLYGWRSYQISHGKK